MRRRDTTTDDDAARDVARDREVIRVRLDMMDSRQRAVFAHFNARDHQPGYVRVSSPAIADARAAARAARSEYVRALQDAWKRTPHKDASEPDAAEALLKRHMRSEPDGDAQARRDRAWKNYCDQLTTAWQTNPRRADEVERQRRQWTAEPMGGA